MSYSPPPTPHSPITQTSKLLHAYKLKQPKLFALKADFDHIKSPKALPQNCSLQTDISLRFPQKRIRDFKEWKKRGLSSIYIHFFHRFASSSINHMCN
jgi:hypothetical protein